MAHDVFIGYATENKAVADTVCAALEGRGIRCWIAPRDGAPGSQYGENLSNAVVGAEILVLVFSQYANHSNHVSGEVQQAFSLEKVIIPFRIEDVPPSKSLGFFIQSIHWLDALTPPLAQHVKTLGDRIQGILGAIPDASSIVQPEPDIEPSEAVEISCSRCPQFGHAIKT